MMKRILAIYIVLLGACTAVWAQMPADTLAAPADSATQQSVNFDKGSFLHFGIGGGFGSWNYSLAGGTVAPWQGSFTGDVTYAWYFLPWLGIGTGVHLSYIASDAQLTRQMTWDGKTLGITDSEGELYNHRVDFNDWHERQNLLFLEIPLALQFKAGTGKAGFYFNIGAKMGIPVYANYNHYRGDLIHSGYYPQWNAVLANLPERFETETFTRAQDGRAAAISWVNGELFGELGMLIRLDRTTHLTLGIYGAYTLNDMNTATDAPALGFRNEAYRTGFMNPYSGLCGTDHISNIHPFAFGLKLGVQTRLLTKAEREQLRREQLMRDHPECLQQKADTQRIMIRDTVFLHDTLYMYIHDTVVDSRLRQDTVYVTSEATGAAGAAGAAFIGLLDGDEDNTGKSGKSGKSGTSSDDFNRSLQDWEDIAEGTDYSYPMDAESHRQALNLDGTLQTSVIWFKFDDYKPILEPFDVVGAVAEALKANPSLHVNVNGHACKIGTDSYNQRLAMKRAKAVAALLRRRGVPAEQMTVRSLGASEPYRYNEGPHQYSKDRRVEIVPAGLESPVYDVNAATAYKDPVNSAPAAARTDIDYEQYTSFIGEEKVREGSHLAQIARRWYGHQVYWVYIYEANADKIARANRIAVGMTVMIPDLSKINAGLTEEEALSKAKELEDRYVEQLLQ